MKLEGKVAAITGGTAGIGRAISEAHLGEGEVVAVALLLASDVGAGITGSIYSVDGGTAAY